MRLDVNEHGTIRLKEVFNSVLFETEEGEKMAVCMRDGGFEIGIKDQTAKGNGESYTWHRVMNGNIEPLTGQNPDSPKSHRRINEQKDTR